ncbi:MAG: lantibiotic dehydratase [Pseudonocardiaceae bacterium]
MCGGRVPRPRRVRRVVESVVQYLLRLTSRATPFGLFAGVAAARIGSTTSFHWGDPAISTRAVRLPVGPTSCPETRAPQYRHRHPLPTQSSTRAVAESASPRKPTPRHRVPEKKVGEPQHPRKREVSRD